MKKGIYLAKLFGLFAVYFVTGRIGLSLNVVNHFATLVWLPSGISLSVLLLSDLQLWPSVFLGAFLVNVTVGATISTALTIGVGNTLEAIAAVYILRQLFFDISFQHVRDIYYFLLAILVGATIASFIGTTAILGIHSVLLNSFVPTFATWWFGDFMSMLILAPFILSWTKSYKDLAYHFSWQRVFEAAILIISLICLSGVIYFGGPGIFKNAPKAYLIFPLFIWTAMSFGMLGSTAAVLLISCIAATGSILGLGPLPSSNPTIRIALTQGFISIATVTTFVLAAVNRERYELDKRKDDFISMASHELRTPITSTKILLQLLLKYPTKNTAAKKLLKKANVQIDQLTYLISDLLNTTTIEQRKLKYNNEAFTAKQAIKNVIDQLRITTSHKFIFLSPIDANIYGDKYRFHQVVSNILMNAIKFSPPTSKIIISLRKKKKLLLVTVQDFGIGIPKIDQVHIFDRFYQIKKNNRDTYPGVGLGLYIVKEIVTHMKGSIWVDSIEGKGTTITFSLPIYNKSQI